AHAWRALRSDAGARELGLLHRHSGRGSGRRRCDLALPLSRARSGGSHLPALCAPHGGFVMLPLSARAAKTAQATGHVRILILFVTFLAFPFAWMVITTFKTTQDLHNVANNPYLFNDPPTLTHLRTLFQDTAFVQWLGNTAAVGVAVVAITLVLAVPAGY